MASKKTDLENQLLRVTDPSDFTRTNIPSLADFDSLLRCHICKDFLNVPVVTPCSHSFCSLCIRQHLRTETKCPLCLQDVQESTLVSEYLLSEVIRCYKKDIRSSLISSLKTKTPEVTVSPQYQEKPDHVDTFSERKFQLFKHRTSDSIMQHTPLRKKLKQENKPKSIMSMLASRKTQQKQKPELGQCPICQKYLPVKLLESTHVDECLSGIPKIHEANQYVVDLERDDNEDNEQLVIDQDLSVSNEDINKFPKDNTSDGAIELTSSPSKDDEKDEIDINTSLEEPEIITPVETPFLNSYLDSALTSSSVKKHKIPKLDTANLALSSLKAKLSEQKLGTTGTKQQMVNRYNQWEMMWNSNFIDSLDPVSEKELRIQLQNWEKHNNNDKSENPNKSILAMFGSSSNSKIDIKSDKFSRKNWSKLQRKEYKELISMAKKSNKKNVKSSKENPT